MEAAKVDNTQEIVIASEKYVLGEKMEVLDWFLVLGGFFVFRPNLYLIPDVDTRCSSNPVCPSGKKIIFHLNVKRLIRQQTNRTGNNGVCILAGTCRYYFRMQR